MAQKIIKCKLFLLILMFSLFINNAFSQNTSGFETLQKENTKTIIKCQYLNSFHLPYNIQGDLNYILPIQNYLKYRDTLISLFGTNGFYQRLATSLMFVSDYKLALYFCDSSGVLNFSNRTLTKQVKKEIRQFKFIDANQYILKIADSVQVLLINESHHKPIHRAFLINLLQSLYNRGYKIITFEALRDPLDSIFLNFKIVNSATGHYINEPVFGELIRTASEIGFKILPYEATTSKSKDRDSIQAINIMKIIQNNPDSKTIVFAGYGHISIDTINCTTMGAFLLKNYKIKSLSIDQTRLSEGGQKNGENPIYSYIIKKHKLKAPSIPIYKKKIWTIKEDENNYNIEIVHPKSISITKNKWLNFDGLRNTIKISKHKFRFPEKTFLVQAYYFNEVNKVEIAKLIPADQTYNLINNSFYLHLRNDKFLIVFRDINYVILKTIKVFISNRKCLIEP